VRQEREARPHAGIFVTIRYQVHGVHHAKTSVHPACWRRRDRIDSAIPHPARFGR
jgi:hypothetical protein